MYRDCVRLRPIGPVRPSCQRGYSLYDLLTTMGVIGVLGVSAIGGLQPLLERERLSTNVNLLVTHMALARSEAIRCATPVTVCKSATGAGCTPDSHWEQGWIVFADADADEELGADETVIRVQQGLVAGHTLEFRAELARNDALTYHPSGRSTRNGTFTMCDRHGTAKTVIVNFVGRARVGDRTAAGDKPQCR
jgi:type IV fimbrial biogenesis protein FimT